MVNFGFRKCREKYFHVLLKDGFIIIEILLDCCNQEVYIRVVSHITQQYKTVDNRKLENFESFSKNTSFKNSQGKMFFNDFWEMLAIIRENILLKQTLPITWPRHFNIMKGSFVVKIDI